MTTSGENSFPSRLTRIDDLTRKHHTFLEVADECFFFGEYTARKSWAHSPTNQLILNFKKPMSRKHLPEWRHKTNAINQVANAFSKAIHSRFTDLTLIPIPPSKLKNDPEYDDRMMKMLHALRAPDGIIPDIRELILQSEAIRAAHHSDNRPRPHELEKIYQINENLSQPKPAWIALIDDVLTTGAHFRAMSNILKRRFPEARITGIFIARRVPEATDWSEFNQIDE
jgi:predicted amidophosphoribosyltransferase